MPTQPLAPVLALTLLLCLSACSKQANVKSSVSELEQAFQTQASPPGGPTVPAAGGPTADNAQELVKAALAAARANDYAGGVITLQAAQRKPGVTAEQLMAVQRTMQALTADLATRAANGDTKALDQLKTIETTRSQ